MSENKLYTTIQINGELELKIPVSDVSLLERELYIDTEGNLYCGNTSGKPIIHINANKANHATKADNLGNSDLPFSIDNVKGIASLNGLVFNELHEIIGSGIVSMKDFSLKDSSFANGTITNLNTMTLNSDMWGTKLPTDNLQHGRVFFLVSEE